MAPSLHEEAARTRKALAYASCIRQHGGTALEAAQLPPEGWEAVQALIGWSTPPSPATMAVVVTMLEGMEAAELRCPPDPFAGLT